MSVVIDADGHIEEDMDALRARLPEDLRDLAPVWLGDKDGRVQYALEGRIWTGKYPYPGGMKNHVSAGGERREGGKDPKVRLAVLEDEGIDAAVLFPSTGLLFGLLERADVAHACCVAYNDLLAEYCATDPAKLVGVALLPQQDPVLAAAELERCVHDFDFVAGVMRPNKIGGRTVDDPAFDVLYETASRLDAPIMLHEAYNSGMDTVGVDRMVSYAGCHIISHPFEQMTAMVSLSLSGVFQRFPNLRVGFFEAGCGWAPTWADRIEEHYELAPADFLGGDPTGVLNTRTYVTFELEEPGLGSTCEQGWADNVCFASDYPHFDAVYPGAVKSVKERQLPPDVEEKILGLNALTLYGPRLARRIGR